jgi:DNA-3-methyladenine glycosylase
LYEEVTNLLEQAFFERESVRVAEDLLGCLLERRFEDGTRIRIRITETEAYRGGDDPASHAHRGMTPRNMPMFGPAGKLYIYLSYGMHHCINIVTEPGGMPGAVLLRGAEPVEGLERVRLNRPGVPDKQLLNGPGKLARGLAVDLSYNGYDLLQEPGGPLRIYQREGAPPFRRTTRIGITKGIELPWRFVTGD